MILHLMSHTLCPYVQRAAICLLEKDIAFERTTIDLANKPDWFLSISPLGKTPVLMADDQPIFESAAILEFLEETQPSPLHPDDPVVRAQHRGWIEFASAILNDIAGLYSAKDKPTYHVKIAALETKFSRIEAHIQDPFFSGENFTLVDACFGPVFRYFDSFDAIGVTGVLEGKTAIAAWREKLAARPSVAAAVSTDYRAMLDDFLMARGSYLSSLITRAPT